MKERYGGFTLRTSSSLSPPSTSHPHENYYLCMSRLTMPKNNQLVAFTSLYLALTEGSLGLGLCPLGPTNILLDLGSSAQVQLHSGQHWLTLIQIKTHSPSISQWERDPNHLSKVSMCLCVYGLWSFSFLNLDAYGASRKDIMGQKADMTTNTS